MENGIFHVGVGVEEEEEDSPSVREMQGALYDIFEQYCVSSYADEGIYTVGHRTRSLLELSLLPLHRVLPLLARLPVRVLYYSC